MLLVHGARRNRHHRQQLCSGGGSAAKRCRVGRELFARPPVAWVSSWPGGLETGNLGTGWAGCATTQNRDPRPIWGLYRGTRPPLKRLDHRLVSGETLLCSALPGAVATAVSTGRSFVRSFVPLVAVPAEATTRTGKAQALLVFLWPVKRLNFPPQVQASWTQGDSQTDRLTQDEGENENEEEEMEKANSLHTATVYVARLQDYWRSVGL